MAGLLKNMMTIFGSFIIMTANDVIIFFYVLMNFIKKIIFYVIEALMVFFHGNGFFNRMELPKELLEVIGYAYDPIQDIFYSVLYPWQRAFGYCRLYDEAAAPMGMIIDCEPVYFDYDGRKWMIEFWKGQYDLTTGCEIGVYTTDGPDLIIPGVFNGTFYECANESDFLKISYILKKNGKALFIRKGRHWWLTGFKLGEFSEPSELSMKIKIKVKDKNMLKAYIKGLMETGYQKNNLAVVGKSVNITFKVPYSKQPFTRNEVTDTVIQMKNKLMCGQFQKIVNGFKTPYEKLAAIREAAPEIYEHILNLGKNKHLFNINGTFLEHFIKNDEL